MTLLFSRDAPGSLLSLHLSPLPCARLTSLNSLSVFSPAVGHAWQPVLRGDASTARGSAPRAEILAAPAARWPSATFALLRKVPGPPRCPSQPLDSPASSRRTHISLFPTGRWQPPVCPRERRPAAAAPHKCHGPRDARRPHACSHLPHRVQLEGDTIPVPGWGPGTAATIHGSAGGIYSAQVTMWPSDWAPAARGLGRANRSADSRLRLRGFEMHARAGADREDVHRQRR